MEQTLNALRIASIGVAVAAAIGFAAQAAEITGAGSTFVYPILAKWAEAYSAKTGLKMNYQSIGSGGGIAQIKAKTVDFGASDMPLKPEELREGRPHAISAGHRRRGHGDQSTRHSIGADDARWADHRQHLLGEDYEME